jgi:hypothetical protein
MVELNWDETLFDKENTPLYDQYISVLLEAERTIFKNRKTLDINKTCNIGSGLFYESNTGKDFNYRLNYLYCISWWDNRTHYYMRILRLRDGRYAIGCKNRFLDKTILYKSILDIYKAIKNRNSNKRISMLKIS